MSPPKGWKKDKAVGQNKTKELAEEKEQIQDSIKKVSIKTNVEEQPNRKSSNSSKEATLQNSSKTEKNKLPKLIISYYNKDNFLVNRVYTCANLEITEQTHSIFEGTPTSRKDIVDVSIEAKVVEIDNVKAG